MALTLISTAFADGERIPAEYTCDGANISPPLAWQGAPDGTRGYALVCSDPDAPAGTWYHWGLFDIPAGWTEVTEAYPTDAEVGTTRQATSDFRRTGYGGPCPPKGHGDHRYLFRLMALDVETLPLADAPDCRDVERAAEDHVVAETTLTGTYGR